MSSKPVFCLVGALLLGLSGCTDHNHTPPFSGGLRIVNGITDSTGLDAAFTGIDLPTDFQNIAFGSASHIAAIPTGNYRAKLSTGDSGGGMASVTVDDIAIDHDQVNTVFAYGQVSDDTAGGFTAAEAISAPDTGRFELQFVHAAYAESLTANGQILTFYLVTPGAGTNATGAALYATNVAFGSSSPATSVAAGTYEIVVKDAQGGLVFDSGGQGIRFPDHDRNVFQIAVLDTPPRPPGIVPPVHCPPTLLLVLDNTGESRAFHSAQACPL